MDRIILNESAHWYDGNGRQVLEVPRATPKKLDDGTLLYVKEPKLDSARKYNLAYSVSKITHYHPTPHSIKNYTRNMWMDSIIDLYEDGITKKDWKQRVIDTCDEIEWQNTEMGKKFHAYIEKRIKGEKVVFDSVMDRAANETIEFVKSLNPERMESERAFCNQQEGVGGTIDFNGYNVLVDHKTRVNVGTFQRQKKSQKVNDDDIVQTSAYKVLASEVGVCAKDARCFINVICQHTGESFQIELTEEQIKWGYSSFKANYRALVGAMKDPYFPWLGFKSGEWKSVEEILEELK